LVEQGQNYLDEIYLPPTYAPYIALCLHTLHLLIRAPLWSLFLSLLPLGRQRRWNKSPSDSVFVQPDNGLGRYDQVIEAGKQGWRILGWLGMGSTSIWGAFGVSLLGHVRRCCVAAYFACLNQNWTFFLIVFALSFANASYLFNSRRRYDMRFRSVSHAARAYDERRNHES